MTLSDSQKQILELLKKNGFSTVSELAELTGFTQKDVRFDLLRLIQQDHVVNIKKLHAFSIYFYRGFLLEATKADVSMMPETVVGLPAKMGRPRISEFGDMREDLSLSLRVPFMTINHQVGWNRIAALKRIRNRLISEYHPVLDSVIADYEGMLRCKED